MNETLRIAHLRRRLLNGSVLCGAFALAICLGAKEPSLLLQPQWEVGLPPLIDQAALKPLVDGKVLSFDAPTNLFEKQTDQAKFVSAVWKDVSDQPIHQRDVLAVGSDYVVIVDYIYGKGTHKIERSCSVATTAATVDTNGVQWKLIDGQTERIQAIDASKPATQPSGDGTAATFTSTVLEPTPVATVLARWTTAALKVEYVKPSNPMIVKLKVSFPDGRVDWVGLSWESRPLHLNGKALNGWAAIARQGPDRSIEIK